MFRYTQLHLADHFRPKHKCMNRIFTLVKRVTYVATLIFLMHIGFPTHSHAQTEPEIIKGWDNLEEAEFLFDVYYQIVKCSSESATEIHFWAFNEGGNVDAVGFTLKLRDKDGTEVTHEVKKFAIGLGQSHKALCENDDYPYLRFSVPEDLDINTLSIDITYNK